MGTIKVNSLDAAINVTMQKYNYNETQRKRIYEELEKGNFSVITNDFGARKFTKKYYKELNQKYAKKEDSPFKDFTTLTKYFDEFLTTNFLTKENPETIKFLYYDILTNMKKNKYKSDIENLLIEAANLYSKQERGNVQVLRKYDFNTIDISRREASDLTSVFSNMDFQKEKVKNAINFYPGYQKALIQNLIEYSYFEHDFSKSLEEQIEACKSSTK